MSSTRPCLFEQLRIWPFPTVPVGRKIRGRILAVEHFASLAPQNDDYQTEKNVARAPLMIHVHAGAAPTHAAQKRLAARRTTLTSYTKSTCRVLVFVNSRAHIAPRLGGFLRSPEYLQKAALDKSSF
jgi:hypothetical protein